MLFFPVGTPVAAMHHTIQSIRMSAYHDLLAGHRFCEEAAEPGGFPGTRLSSLEERGLRVSWEKREANVLAGVAGKHVDRGIDVLSGEITR